MSVLTNVQLWLEQWRLLKRMKELEQKVVELETAASEQDVRVTNVEKDVDYLKTLVAESELTPELKERLYAAIAKVGAGVARLKTVDESVDPKTPETPVPTE